MSIIEEFSQNMVEEFDKVIDLRVIALLDKHNLPHDREKLKEMGYELIIDFKNNSEMMFFKRDVTIKLVKIVDKDNFNFTIRTNII